jgi:hypothetical protein
MKQATLSDQAVEASKLLKEMYDWRQRALKLFKDVWGPRVYPPQSVEDTLVVLKSVLVDGVQLD